MKLLYKSAVLAIVLSFALGACKPVATTEVPEEPVEVEVTREVPVEVTREVVVAPTPSGPSLADEQVLHMHQDIEPELDPAWHMGNGRYNAPNKV